MISPAWKISTLCPASVSHPGILFWSFLFNLQSQLRYEFLEADFGLCVPRIFAWRIPWTEEPGGVQSMGSQRVRHDSVTNTNQPLTLQQEGLYTFLKEVNLTEKKKKKTHKKPPPK